MGGHEGRVGGCKRKDPPPISNARSPARTLRSGQAKEYGRMRIGSIHSHAGRVLAIVVSIVALEVGLRIFGYQPATGTGVPSLNYMTDASVGWLPRPGSYTGVYGGQSNPVHVTHLEDSTRAVLPAPASSRHPQSPAEPQAARILLTGGSFVHGYGLSDAETIPSRIQQQLTDNSIVNLGAGGYGTYQASLRADQYRQASGKEAGLVVYFYIPQHLDRNVATPQWILELARMSSNHSAFVPYCEIDEDQLRCSPPRWHFPNFPLRDQSSIVRLIEELWVAVNAYPRVRQRDRVAEALITKFYSDNRARGTDFLVILLDSTPDGRFLEMLKRNEIPFGDCTDDRYRLASMRLLEDEHPNAEMANLFAQCAARHIQETRSVAHAL
jgi:hypothetical protein